jgi:hypothetical protein
MRVDLSLADFLGILATGTRWSNENQGVVTIAIFLVTIVLGWLSGIFAALRRKPKFKLTIITGPTFCCNFRVGKRYQGYESIERVSLFISIFRTLVLLRLASRISQWAIIATGSD